MKNEAETEEKLIQELEVLRLKVAGFEKAEIEHQGRSWPPAKAKTDFVRFLNILTMRYLS